MEGRITPKRIRKVKDNEVFVFGSNLKGIHGKGAALDAMGMGAVRGNGHGIQGNTYALPTKQTPWISLPLDKIESYVKVFLAYAIENPDKTFLVTRIGCMNAGYTPTQIAPFFRDALSIQNVYLPADFWEIINASKLF